MNKAEKQQVIDELTATLKGNRSVLLMNFTGLKVADATELRRKVTQTGSQYRVVKNTLAWRASQNAALAKLKDCFQGPTAMAYTAGDPIALAKVLTEFARAHPEITFKGGVLDAAVISGDQVLSLADMPSRTELLSKLLMLLNAPLSRLAGALQSPLRSLALLMKQLEVKKGQ